jgi:RNA polymerase sigma-70 factor (ECF subfamily)
METVQGKTLVHQELLESCKRGDTQAQMKIYRLYYKPMYHVSLRILGDSMEAEDVMQEAFLTAFRNLDTISLNISFGGWLKRIVINRSLDALRKRKGQIELTPDFPDEPEPEPVWQDDQDTVEEKVRKVKRAMEFLPDKYRMVLNLCLFEGYDHEEVGEILGIPASTSRAHLSRGKQKLLHILSAPELQFI